MLEGDALTQLRFDPTGSFALTDPALKIPLEEIGWDGRGGVAAVNALSPAREHASRNIRGMDPPIDRGEGAQKLGEDDPQGVRFLARRAGGRPDAERGRCGPYELGQDLLGEKVEVLGLAEEFRVVGRDEVDEVVNLVSAGR